MKHPRTATLTRAARARLGISRRAFAKLIWTGERVVANWEDGNKPPSAAVERFLVDIRDGYTPQPKAREE